MKVAVSIPDDLFAQADELAAETGSTRSAIYAEALANLLRQRRDESITARIDAALEGIDQEGEGAFAIRAGRRTLARSRW